MSEEILTQESESGELSEEETTESGEELSEETEEESEGEGETEEGESEEESEEDDSELNSEELKSLSAMLGSATTIAKPISLQIKIPEDDFEELSQESQEESVQENEKPPTLKSVKNLKLPPITVPPPSTSITENLKPKKEIIIQPASKEEVEASLSPKPGKKAGRPKKVAVTTETVKEGKKKIKAPPLEKLLVKESVETNEFFAMRSAYSQKAAQYFPKEESNTHLLLGYYGANRGKYGLTYPEQTEKVLEYIDQMILSE